MRSKVTNKNYVLRTLHSTKTERSKSLKSVPLEHWAFLTRFSRFSLKSQAK